MWICLSESFLSIVQQHCGPDELLVRARRKGDIEKIFPNAKVNTYPEHDYLYAAILPRSLVVAVLAQVIEEIDYPKFKPTVKDPTLHAAYFEIWDIMAMLQQEGEYGE